MNADGQAQEQSDFRDIGVYGRQLTRFPTRQNLFFLLLIFTLRIGNLSTCNLFTKCLPADETRRIRKKANRPFTDIIQFGPRNSKPSSFGSKHEETWPLTDLAHSCEQDEVMCD